jgi:hypothetical protein
MLAVLSILYIVPMLVVAIGSAVMLDPVLYWTHRKGYITPAWKTLVASPLFLLGLLGTIVVGVTCMGATINGLFDLPAAALLGLYLLMFVPAPAGIGLSLLILKLLPKRRMRISGSHRSGIPYAGIGYASIIFAGIFVIFCVMNPDYLPETLRCIPVTILFSGMMFYQARRAKTPTVEEVIANDRRPPVLYLRSFDQESTRFAEVSPEAAARYSEITSYQRTLLSYNLTLEQFFGREITRTIGPFIALGNPTDYLQPEGAYRTYASDGNWQEYFTDLSDRATGILMQMGNSDNLNWELVSIRNRGLQTKLFVITSPLSEADEDPYSVTRFFTRFTDRIKGIKPASWSRFAETLERAGYRACEEPGSGAVVTFDRSNQAVKLVTGARTPTEYVIAITRWLEKLSKNGAQQGNAKVENDRRDAERDRVGKYGIQIVICSSCGTKNSLSFSNCINCSKDLSTEKPVPNPFL